MKEMMELTQNREEIPVLPLHVQMLSHPYMGSLSLRGAPAQFGPSFDNISAVRGFCNISQVWIICFKLMYFYKNRKKTAVYL